MLVDNDGWLWLLGVVSTWGWGTLRVWLMRIWLLGVGLLRISLRRVCRLAVGCGSLWVLRRLCSVVSLVSHDGMYAMRMEKMGVEERGRRGR